MSFKSLIEHQRAFNRLIWDPENKKTPAALVDRLRQLALGMVEESLEFIRTYDFKSHRKPSPWRLQNVAHSHEELIDMFKYWLSIADAADFPFDRLEELYYAKSRVVQYRYQEEMVRRIDPERKIVVVDIDNVLADYIAGICYWGRRYGIELMGPMTYPEQCRYFDRLTNLSDAGEFISAETVGVAPEQWRRVKHHFRTNGGKRILPVFDDAKPFLKWCRSNGWLIILVTSRPVDRYPNIFSDTLAWLEKEELPFDLVWWADEKGERLEEAAIRDQIVFAVDDSLKFIQQFNAKGVKSYWLVRRGQIPFEENCIPVRSLRVIMERETPHGV